MPSRAQARLQDTFETPVARQVPGISNNNEPKATKPVKRKTAQEQFAIQSAMMAKIDVTASPASLVTEEVKPSLADKRLSIQIGYIIMTSMGQQQQSGGLLFKGPSQK